MLIHTRLPGTGGAVSRVLADSRRSLAAALLRLSESSQELYRSAARSTAAGVFALALVATAPGAAATAAVAAPPADGPVVAAGQAPAAEAEAPETNPYRDPSQCVYLAWDLAAEAGHRLPKFGDAHDWRQGAINHGYKVMDTLSSEAVNSLAVWESYAGGTSWAGHVAWVTEVRGDEFYVRERNWVRATDTGRWVRWEDGISFIVLEAEPPGEPRAAEKAEPPAPAPEAAEDAQQEELRLEDMAHEQRWSRTLRGELVDASRPERASRGAGALALPGPLRDLLALGDVVAGPLT